MMASKYSCLRWRLAASVLLACAAPARADLVSHWTFEDALDPGKDSGPAGFDAVSTIGSPAVSPQAKIGFGALSLDGISALVLPVEAAAAYTGEDFADGFSVAAWINIDPESPSGPATDGPQPFQRIISRDLQASTGWTGRGWGVGIDRSTAENDRLLGTTFGLIDRRSEVTSPAGAWHHVAYIYRAPAGALESVDFYVDGVWVGGDFTGPAGLLPAEGADTWLIGALNFTGGNNFQGFQGLLDDLRLYDSELTEEEITTLAAGSPPPLTDPVLSIAAAFPFTSNGGASQLTVPYANAGATKALHVSGVTLSGADAAKFTVASFDATVAAGGTGAVKLNFAGAPGGVWTASLTITSDDPVNASRSAAVQVTAQNPVISPASASVVWPVIPAGQTPAPITLKVTNTGGSENLVLSSAVISGASAGSFEAVSFPPSLAPGATGDIVLRFNPAGKDGAFSAVLTINSNSTVNAQLAVPLSAYVPIGNLSAALVSHFTFDDPANPFADSGSFALNGTPWGDAALTTSAKIGTGALVLDGFDDYVTVDGAAEYSALGDAADGDGFTVAAWVQLDVAAIGTNWRLFSTGMPEGFSAAGWGVGALADGGLMGTTYGVIDYQTAANRAPAPDEWHHLAYAYRGSPVSSCDFYMDGALVSTGTGASGYKPTASGFVIGALGIGMEPLQYFAGKIDDLRIYSRTLEEPEIGALLSPSGPVETLVVTSVSWNGGKPQFTWLSTTGATYTVSRSSDLQNWTPLNPALPSAGTATTFTDEALPAGTAKAFYRAERNP